MSLLSDYMSSILDIVSPIRYTPNMMKTLSLPPRSRRFVAYYACLMAVEILVPHVPHVLYGALAIVPLVMWRPNPAAQ